MNKISDALDELVKSSPFQGEGYGFESRMRYNMLQYTNG